jgi:hypothetical protein
MKINLNYKDAKSALAYVLGIAPARRNVSVLPDDIFIVSFPKSGNTWVRFLVANILFGEEQNVSFLNIEKLSPDIYQHSDAVLSECDSPRVLKSHEYFDPRYNRVILVVRDPRDVAVSQYYFMIKNRQIDESLSITDFVDKFINSETSRFGNWSENIGSWLGAMRQDLCLIRYENIKSDTANSVNKIACFLGKKLTDSQIQNVIEKSSFKSMQSMERVQGKSWKPTKKSRQDIPFVRSGEVGQWQSELPEEAAEKIWNVWSERMIQLGYEKG